MSDKLLVDCFEMTSKEICSSNPCYTNEDLLNAWRKKDLDNFKKILSANECDPNFLYENDDYMRLLDTAAKDGNVEFAKAIIKAQANINLLNPIRSKAPIHFAAEAAHLDMLKLLISSGADVNILDSTGSTVCHYMVKQKWEPNNTRHKSCLNYLLQLDNLNPNVTNRKGLTAIHLAAMQGSEEAVKIFLEQKGSILNIDSKGGSPSKTAREEILDRFPHLQESLPTPRDIHDIKMDGNKLFLLLHAHHEDRFCDSFLQEIKSEKKLLKYTDGKHTFLQFCCEKKFSKAVKVLLECNADVNYAPNFTTRPVLIACRKGDTEILRLLLGKKPDLSPNEEGENPLHIVVKHSRDSEDHFSCLQMFLRRLKETNLDINAQDFKGNTPLHYAVKYGRPKCVEELLRHGAYIGILNKFKKPPLAEMSASALENYLDSCITATDMLDHRSNYIVKFDYNFLVPKSQTFRSDADDVKVPLTDEAEPVVRNDPAVPECQPLLYISKDSHLKKILVHPVLTSFILLKWQRVRVFYYVNLAFYALFCALITIYILFGYRSVVLVEKSVGESIKELDLNRTVKIAHDKYAGVVEHTSESIIISGREGNNKSDLGNSSGLEVVVKESASVEFLRICLIICLVVLTLRELFQAVLNFKKYISDPENWLEILLLLALAFVFLKDCSKQFPKSTFLALWCPQFSALAILLSWFELVLLVGKHPLQSLHIEMFKTVSVNFMRFLAWYAMFIVAFALAFFTLFRDCSGDCQNNNPFTNLGLSLFKSIVMLTGEFDASDIPFISYIGTSHLIFIAFIFLIAIVLLNLLNGLAVTDTQTIRDNSYLFRCIALVKLICYIENMLLVEPSPFSCFKRVNLLENNKKGISLNCFDYLAKRIIFFPKLLKDGVIYVLPNQSYKVYFTDPKSSNSTEQEEPPCLSRVKYYYLDPKTAKTAEKILKKRLAAQENTSADLDTVKKEVVSYGGRMKDIENKIELLEHLTKQNEKLLIQILTILSLNNANNEERRATTQ